jgi:hypothetical protein
MCAMSESPGESGSPRCEEHDGAPAEMTPEVMHVQVSGVAVPVRGWRCPVCRADHILSADARAAREYAQRMGFVRA